MGQLLTIVVVSLKSRPGLESRDRQLVTLGMLTALTGCEPQLGVHINGALNVGFTLIASCAAKRFGAGSASALRRRGW